ncbi:MAG: phosphatidylserine decarboxylase [Candidatus Fonsibacter sp.]
MICEVKQGQNLNQGDRIGIIRFGSRVDLYFDNDYKLLAKQGQTVVAGESLLAKI